MFAIHYHVVYAMSSDREEIYLEGSYEGFWEDYSNLLTINATEFPLNSIRKKFNFKYFMFNMLDMVNEYESQISN